MSLETWDSVLVAQHMAVSLMHHRQKLSVHLPDCLCNTEYNVALSQHIALFAAQHAARIIHGAACTSHHSLLIANHSLFTFHHSPDRAGNGYLCSIRPSVYAQHYEENLPESMTGADFLAKYHHHYDHATQVGIAPLNFSLRLLHCPCGL